MSLHSATGTGQKSMRPLAQACLLTGIHSWLVGVPTYQDQEKIRHLISTNRARNRDTSIQVKSKVAIAMSHSSQCRSWVIAVVMSTFSMDCYSKFYDLMEHILIRIAVEWAPRWVDCNVTRSNAFSRSLYKSKQVS